MINKEISVNHHVGTGVKFTFTLDDAEIEALFKEAFDGWCPVCLNCKINVGEAVCCDCLQAALGYHQNTCGCIMNRQRNLAEFIKPKESKMLIGGIPCGQWESG